VLKATSSSSTNSWWRSGAAWDVREPGARKALMKDERQRFLEEDWPKVYATIQRSA